MLKNKNHWVVISSINLNGLDIEYSFLTREEARVYRRKMSKNLKKVTNIYKVTSVYNNEDLISREYKKVR